MAGWINEIRDVVWGPWLLTFLLGTGVYLCILLRGLPVRKLFRAVKMALGPTEADQKDGISSFSSLATELAATIGTGNVVGVAMAMTAGGPGALLWMMISALIGLSTKLTESTLSVKYRVKDGSGLPKGGPMITLSKAFPLPKTGKVLAGCYAFFAVLCSLGMGNAVQSSSIASSFHAAFGWKERTVGMILAMLTLLAVTGGMKRISKIATYLVPAMGAIYVAGCLGIMALHWQNLLPGLKCIIVGAFSPKAVSGGVFGTITASWIKSLNAGVSCGVFSNEAGLGAGGISAAASSEEDPVRQGWISTSAVFFDTLVICVITGIAYACSGVANTSQEGELLLKSGMKADPSNGADLMIAAFETTFGRYGGAVLGTCIALFAFATILGWAAQGQAAFAYLFGEKRNWLYQAIYSFFTFVGATAGLGILWTLSDLANGLLAIPNLICLWVMGPKACREILAWEMEQGSPSDTPKRIFRKHG